MSIKAICPHCDSVYTLADAAAGKRVKCKKCDQAFTVTEEVLEAEAAEGQLKAGTPSRLPPPARRSRAGVKAWSLSFDQADITRARAFLRFFNRKLDALTLAQQLEYRTTHRAAMEEVLDPAFVANEAESFVNQESCDCPGRHSRSPPFRTPKKIPGGLSRLRARLVPNPCRGTPSQLRRFQR